MSLTAAELLPGQEIKIEAWHDGKVMAYAGTVEAVAPERHMVTLYNEDEVVRRVTVCTAGAIIHPAQVGRRPYPRETWRR